MADDKIAVIELGQGGLAGSDGFWLTTTDAELNGLGRVSVDIKRGVEGAWPVLAGVGVDGRILPAG